MIEESFVSRFETNQNREITFKKLLLKIEKIGDNCLE